MTKKHEELVEEIAGQIRHYKYFAEKRAPTPSDRIKASFDLAELFITLTLSAVCDGLEIPGEAGRVPIQNGMVDHKDQLIYANLTGELIALRKREDE